MDKAIVTTSWDDGNKLDLKLMEILEKYKIMGTFYISPGSKYYGLTGEEIKELARRQELGAHTTSHSHLTVLDELAAKKEIVGSKEYLENLSGQEVKMFSYPYGEFNQTVKNLVKEAGFLGARTVEDSLARPSKDFFEFGTTLQIYPISFWQVIRFLKWPRLAKNLFDHVFENNGIYHLWGHSWEIEKYGMWGELTEIFRRIAGQKNVLYLTNSQTLETLLYENFNPIR